MKISDGKAEMAVQTLKKYCSEHEKCIGCVFNKSESGYCVIEDSYPLNWEIEEDA